MDKKELYESIMKNVAKQVKSAINEAVLDEEKNFKNPANYLFAIAKDAPTLKTVMEYFEDAYVADKNGLEGFILQQKLKKDLNIDYYHIIGYDDIDEFEKDLLDNKIDPEKTLVKIKEPTKELDEEDEGLDISGKEEEWADAFTNWLKSHVVKTGVYATLELICADIVDENFVKTWVENVMDFMINEEHYDLIKDEVFIDYLTDYIMTSGTAEEIAEGVKDNIKNCLPLTDNL